MTTQVQKRRGTTAEHSTFTGAEGEITVDTSKDVAVVHDGVTTGGHPLAAEDLGNVAASTIASKLNGTALAGVDINSGAIDGTIIGASSPSTGAFSSVDVTGNITVGGTVDGRDVATDGTKLDGIEAGADVTDTLNVTLAGAVMDSELTDITAVKNINQGLATSDAVSFATVNGRAIATDGAKLDTIESGADVTDTANVTAAGALMDSELTYIAGVKGLNQGVASTDSPTFANVTTGGITATSLTMGDLEPIYMGTSGTFQIYNNGGSSYVKETDATGNMVIQANDLYLTNSDWTANYLYCNNGAGVHLTYNNGQKFETITDGTLTHGTAYQTTSGATVASQIENTDNATISRIKQGSTYWDITHNTDKSFTIDYNDTRNSLWLSSGAGNSISSGAYANTSMAVGGNLTIENDSEAWFQTYSPNLGTDIKRWRAGSISDGSYLVQRVNDAYSAAYTKLQISDNNTDILTTLRVGNASSGAKVNINSSAAGEYHLFLDNTNASYASSHMLTARTRANASSGFNYIFCESGAFGGSYDVEGYFRGDGNWYIDGNYNAGGADYAEYFEWADGNTANEDRMGMTVSLVNGQIKIAEEGEHIIGCISGISSVVGDTAQMSWTGKYLQDDFGRYVMEDIDVVSWSETVVSDDMTSEDKEHSYYVDNIPADVTVPDDAVRTTQQRKKLNPDYDESAEYVPREDRVEWDVVGLVGKLRVRKDQVIPSNWIKMRDISDAVAEYFVK